MWLIQHRKLNCVKKSESRPGKSKDGIRIAMTQLGSRRLGQVISIRYIVSAKNPVSYWRLRPPGCLRIECYLPSNLRLPSSDAHYYYYYCCCFSQVVVGIYNEILYCCSSKSFPCLPKQKHRLKSSQLIIPRCCKWHVPPIVIPVVIRLQGLQTQAIRRSGCGNGLGIN